MTDVLGHQKLAKSAEPLLRQGERVQGAIPATASGRAMRALRRIPYVRLLVLPVSLVHLVKTPLRAIVWTDQRLLVMTRGMGFGRHKVRKVVTEHPRAQPVDGDLNMGEYKVTSLGKPLYVAQRHLQDLLRLHGEASKT